MIYLEFYRSLIIVLGGMSLGVIVSLIYSSRRIIRGSYIVFDIQGKEEVTAKEVWEFGKRRYK